MRALGNQTDCYFAAYEGGVVFRVMTTAEGGGPSKGWKILCSPPILLESQEEKKKSKLESSKLSSPLVCSRCLLRFLKNCLFSTDWQLFAWSFSVHNSQSTLAFRVGR